MAKKKKYQKLSKEELMRRLETLESSSKANQEMQAVLHDLQVHQEQVRVQHEQLLEVKKSLEQSRDRYADLYDFAPIGYVTLSTQGLVQEINLTGALLLGIDRARIVGLPLANHIHVDDRMLFFDHMRRCRASKSRLGEGIRTELRLASRKTGTFPAELFSRASIDKDGGPIAFHTVVSDLTQQKKIEEEKRQLTLREQAARAAAEAKDEFLAVVSHELRTPLTAVLLWAKLLRSGHVTANQQDMALGAIEHSAAAQQQLIEDLLDISRLVSGRLRLEIRETDIVSVIQGAVDTVRPAAELKGVHLELDLNERLGMVRLDPDRMRQVVWNLVHNGVKFTPPGGSVLVRVHRDHSSLTFEVKDTGQGISADFLPHVFERFQQADSGPTRPHGGLGLGLAIARQLVELHGGTIGVKSGGVGKGSTFTVELPASAANRKSSKGSQHPQPEAGEAILSKPALQNLRILLVEDDQDTRNVVAVMLEGCGASVTAVDSAAAALRVFEATLGLAQTKGTPAFDVLISDIAMPQQDGYELIRAIRKLEDSVGANTRLPAIALTAYVRERHRVAALEAGFQEYIPKPVNPEALIGAALKLVNEKWDSVRPQTEKN